MNKEESISISEHRRVKRCFEEELKRKNDLIDKLKVENDLIMKSALKQSENRAELNEKLEKLSKSHKALLMRLKGAKKS